MPVIKQFKTLEDVANAPLSVVIMKDGKEVEYSFSAIGLWEQAEAKRRMRKIFLDSYDEYVKGLPLTDRPSDAESRKQRTEILARLIPDSELIAWWNTLEGMHFWCWQSVHIRHEELTLEDVAEWVEDAELINKLTDMIAGISRMFQKEGEEGEEIEDGSDPPMPSKYFPSGKPTSPDSSGSTE